MDTSSRLVHRLNWTPVSLSESPLKFDKVVLLVPDDEDCNSELVSTYKVQIADEGYSTAVVGQITEIDALLSPNYIIVHIPNTASTKDGVYEAVHKSCMRLIEAARLLQQRRQPGKPATASLFSLTLQDSNTGDLACAPLSGLARVLKMEIPDIFGGLFEVDDFSFPTSAIKYAHGFDVVRVRNGIAQTASLQPFPDEPNAGTESQLQLQLDPGKTYLVTGGTRGMGLEIATWMGERGARNLILVSRHGIPATPDGSKPDAAVEKLLSRISALEALGVRVHVLAIDLGEHDAGPKLSQAIDHLRMPSIKGVVHAAGVAGHHTLERCTPSDMAEVLAPKVTGGLALDALFPPGILDFFVLTSSVGQLVGFEGQLTYAPANAFLEGLAAHRRRQGDNSTSILWSSWRGVGLMAQSKSATRMISRGMQARGIADISQEEAFAAWDRIAGLDTDHAVVVRALELSADEPLRHPMLKDVTPRKPACNGTQDERGITDYPEHAVAVVGMACQTAAGDTPESLWQVLLEGKSMAQKLPLERFPEAAGKPEMWANLLPHVESFDHQFFKKTRREAAALDPHQRLLLQATYHALESAGWLGGDQTQQEPETHENSVGPCTKTTTTTGCFIGMNAPDWPLNLASHPASPYTGGGMLRSFAAGRLSHHFGWTGPSHTVDTACSSAMVAVHQACRALQLGECTRAVAGGANLVTNTALFDALRVGGFLSATGPCKTFDARADGYCRGEAVGVVVLKPLRAALRDGDDVQGVLLATGNNQNINCTSITNPVLESQAALYRDVLARARVHPHDISYVEAHGTGTPAGDPVEMAGIRQVLGGKDRASTLHVGAVKANVGHSEGASGIVSLIKVLLMMRYGKITPQTQFESLNPNIRPLISDRLAIATSVRDWGDRRRLALVNSYGASGNNAAAVVAPPPSSSPWTKRDSAVLAASDITSPIIISAASTASLASYCEKLKDQIKNLSFKPTLPDLAFALATKRSRQHQQLFCTTAKSLHFINAVTELKSQLSNPEKFTSAAQRPQPVVLLFSGQNGDTVPSARPLYDSSMLFQNYLRQCDETIQSLGLPSLFPAVLDGLTGDSDLILRHAAMFAIQYSSGMSWLDSGLHPQAVCGHSFGEWAAATVSGVMTLEAGMRLVTGLTIPYCSRASIIQRLWGDDTGSMIAIEADLVKKDISPTVHLDPFFKQQSETKLSVACYNGPNHYVVAGPTPDIELLESHLKARKSGGEAMRFKVLKGMHAYHSAMADPIIEESAKLSATIPFQDPKLPFESCHAGTWSGSGSNVIASNTRGPVYFTQAITRIVDRLGPCTFLEAGLGGPIVAMARNAIPQARLARHNFVAIDSKEPVRSLANATLTLWKSGQSHVQFWPFHKSQRADYAAVVLPHYQFEQNRHWLDYAPRLEGDTAKTAAEGLLTPPSQCPHCLRHTSDFPYISQEASGSRGGTETFVFKVDARSRRYQELVQGHAVVGSPICPAAMYLELATLAVASLTTTTTGSETTVDSLVIKSPLGLDMQRSISLIVTKRSETTWGFELSSTKKGEKPTSHATGTVILGKPNSRNSILNCGLINDRDRWVRVTQLLEKDVDADALRGAMVYKVFSSMAKYAPRYRGLRHLAGKGAEGAGEISMPTHDLDPAARSPNDSLADPFIMDNFLQVPGAFVHSLRGAAEEGEEDGGMSYICTGMGSVGPMDRQLPDHGGFRAYAKVVGETSSKVSLDVFAIDKTTQKTIWAAKGLQFSRVPRISLAKVLAGANPEKGFDGLQPSDLLTATSATLAKQSSSSPSQTEQSAPIPTIKTDSVSRDKANLVTRGVQEILAKSLDVPIEEVKEDATLEELGADSLVSPEILGNISSKFGIDISSDKLSLTSDVASLCALVSSTVGRENPNEYDEPDEAPPVTNGNATMWQDAVFKSLSDSLDVDMETIRLNSKLEDLGVDSLISGEIIGRLNEALNVDITSSELSAATDVAAVCQLIAESLGVSPATPQSYSTPATSSQPGTPPPDIETLIGDGKKNPGSIHAVFQQVRGGFDAHAKDTKLSGYWDHVYPQQLGVVTAFIVEGFEKLGCPILSFKEGGKLPVLQETLPKYSREVARLWDILEEAGIAEARPDGWVRGPTSSAVIASGKSAKELSAELIYAFPQFASTHGLPDLLGPHLAECLTGQADPVALLFGSDKGRTLLEDFYANGPDLRAATQVLCDFVLAATRAHAASSSYSDEPFRILEIGAGTGGTTRHLVPLLQATGLPFAYTFTDVSVSLVARAKKAPEFRRVAGGTMDFRKLDVEAPPPADLLERYHLVVSSNCVHATRDLRRSLTHIRQMVRPRDGALALVELTQRLAWYDLVWGLLDGWWLFDDGRDYALQSPFSWERAMRAAGFSHVDWSEGATRESRSVRVICAMTAAEVEPEHDRQRPAKATSMLLHRGAGTTSSSKGRNLFLVPDGFGSGAVFGPLAPMLARVEDMSVFALNSPFHARNNQHAGLDQPPTIEQLAALYVAELQRRQPEGPYLIGGYSIGGLVAYEMTRLLLEDHCQVEKLFLIDTACPALAPSMPETLVDYLESISSYLGILNEDEVRGNNHGRLLKGQHFTLARQQLAVYKASALPGRKRPHFVLFSARGGVDKQSAIARPVFSDEDRQIAEWFLDDRPDSGESLGWDEFLGSPISVVHADGNHFSMVTPDMVKGWGSKLAEMLE
ncbi:polyketide synthase [Apiospora marii]|uniref:polyketide synthase n=1 Tax=Apiospora marii TaxID=335849 RepID=UPI00312D13FD